MAQDQEPVTGDGCAAMPERIAAHFDRVREQLAEDLTPLDDLE